MSFGRFLPAFLITLALISPVIGAAPNSPPGRLLGRFQLDVVPPGDDPPIPLRSINRLESGSRLRYQPGSMSKQLQKKGKIALVLVPTGAGAEDKLQVLEPRPAGKACEWTIPYRVSVVSLVVGPTGLDQKKIDKLLERNHELVPMLAQYAEQTGQWEGLLNALSDWEQSAGTGDDLKAVLGGFAARNALPVPKLSSSASPEEQVSVMMRALTPALSTYDPLTAGRSTTILQSTGLVASVAGLFFGTPVGLAAGGAALFQNFRTMLFPDCEFRSALAQGVPAEPLALYAKPEASKSRTRLAYLWATRVPDQSSPQVSLDPSVVHLPLGLKSTVKLAGSPADLRRLPRARGWALVPAGGGERVPTEIEFLPALDGLSLHPSADRLSPGTYRLEGQWDWEFFSVSGSLEIAPLGDIAAASLTPDSLDRLVQGSGSVTVKLEGPDFQFLKSVQLDVSGETMEIPFRLPVGKQGGVQRQVEIDINTDKVRAGDYRLLLSQSDSHRSAVAIKVHPPHPKFTELPIRLNLGEREQRCELRGTRLDRLTGLNTTTGRWSLLPASPGAEKREVLVDSLEGVAKGTLLNLTVQVKDIREPLVIPQAVEIRGPRPHIAAVDRSGANHGTVTLRNGEIANGTIISYAMRVENLESPPTVELSCGEKGRVTRLRPGERNGQVKLDMAGDQILFLSLDPEGLGEAGCRLMARVSTESAGVSDPYLLGTAVKLPRLESFSLSDEQVRDGFYAGTLVGEDLQLILKVGWDGENGYPVESIPTPIGGDFRKQSLRISLPWPAPRPHAPVYLWLRGEEQGRPTRVGY